VTLELDVQERNRYNRTLAYVYVRDGRMVNEEMARLGLVLVTDPANVKHVERIRQRETMVGWRGVACGRSVH
jgi:micrococcal nuclease